MDCGAADPFLSDDSTGPGTRGSEIVRCVCEVEEDNDFMIQVNTATLRCATAVVKLLRSFTWRELPPLSLNTRDPVSICVGEAHTQNKTQKSRVIHLKSLMLSKLPFKICSDFVVI